MPAADENATNCAGDYHAYHVATSSDPAEVSRKSLRTTEHQYEFKPHENKIIGELASQMHFVGLFLLAIGFVGHRDRRHE